MNGAVLTCRAMATSLRGNLMPSSDAREVASSNRATTLANRTARSDWFIPRASYSVVRSDRQSEDDSDNLLGVLGEGHGCHARYSSRVD